jgi:hypothetical protein
MLQDVRIKKNFMKVIVVVAQNHSIGKMENTHVHVHMCKY